MNPNIDWKMNVIQPVIQLIINNSPKIYDFIYKYLRDEKINSLFDIAKIDKTDKILKLKEPLTGMLAPLTLSEGNINEIENDWPKVIKNYSDDFCEENFLLPYCYNTIWRMWGPSYEHYIDNDRYEIFQFGYGNENNSVPIVISTQLIKYYNIKEHIVTPVKTDGIIVPVKNEKLGMLLGTILTDELNEKFSKILVVGKDLNEKFFGITKVDDPTFLFKKPNDFYSAYVWAKLQLKNFGDFYVFEHGNIANLKILDEYVELLSIKIKHLYAKYGKENVTIKDYFLKKMENLIKQNLGL